jgi:hypothetical protein
MKNLKDIVLERLVLPKNRKPATQIPDTMSGADNTIFNRIFKELKDMANRLNLDPDSDDLSKLETYINHHLPQSLRTKEKIWAYISCTLGYDYMFDDSDMDLWDAGYLHPDWEDTDPIYELAYRATDDAYAERNK